MTIKILVCDDDPRFVQKMVDSIHKQHCDVKITVTGCTDPGALNDKALSEFHLMFLDVDMGQYSGLSIARRVRDLRLDTLLIFVTHYIEFSIQGYELSAFRYLLKSDLDKKLPVYFKEAISLLAQKADVFHFFIGGEEYEVKYQNILYIESHARTVTLHYFASELPEREFYAKMSELEEQLFPVGFLRVHKSFLVNMRHIETLNYNKVQLKGGITLPVSQKNFQTLKLCYMNWKAQQ